MNILEKLIHPFTESFRSVPVKDSFEKLKDLSEKLELIEDPSIEEMKLYESVNMVLEKLSILDNHLSKIKFKTNSELPGNILSDLYEKSEAVDKSYLFKIK